MRKSVLIACLLAFSTANAFAAYSPECGKKRGLFKGRQTVTLYSDKFHSPRPPRSAPVTVQRAYRDYLRLLDHSPEFIRNGVEVVQSRAYSQGRFIGYTIELELGDESHVTYYLDENEKFLAWYWSNQSPISGWICEK